MFKAGDKAIRVRIPRYMGIRTYSIVEIGKVHKTGRLVLKGETDQWRYTQPWSKDERDYFEPCCDFSIERLYAYSEELIAELNLEKELNNKRFLLNKVGDKLSSINDDKQGAKLWDSLPNEFKELLKDEKQVS